MNRFRYNFFIISLLLLYKLIYKIKITMENAISLLNKKKLSQTKPKLELNNQWFKRCDNLFIWEITNNQNEVIGTGIALTKQDAEYMASCQALETLFPETIGKFYYLDQDICINNYVQYLNEFVQKNYPTRKTTINYTDVNNLSNGNNFVKICQLQVDKFSKPIVGYGSFYNQKIAKKLAAKSVYMSLIDFCKYKDLSECQKLENKINK